MHVPVNYKLHAKELAYVLADSGARVVLVSEALHPAARDAGADPAATLVLGSADYLHAVQQHGAPMPVHDRAPDDIASLFYTSGTTGRPKGVMQTHRNLLAMTACYFTDVDDVLPGDAMVYAAPMSHGAGLYNYAQVLRGGRHVVPVSGGFDPAELVQLAASVGQLTLFAAPTMVHRLADHVRATGADVSGFKTIVYGGGPMYADDLRTAMAVMGDDRFVQIYGQGESPMTITALSRAHLADTTHPAGPTAWPRSAWRSRWWRCAWSTPKASPCPPATPARCWCAATPSCPATGTTPTPQPARCRAAGCTRAMWACWMPMAS